MPAPTKLTALAAALLAIGCVTVPRQAGPPAAPAAASPLGFPNTVRTIATDARVFAPDALSDVFSRLRAARDGSLDILALSGGGAGGAFGAGFLTGLSQAGNRPTFEIVTGVSTGALIAPFAFLGAEWDDELETAYTGEHAANLMRARGMSALFRPGLYLGEPLTELVDSYVTLELIDAVARESRRGRLLLVATTNLDSQDNVVWDMGAVAQQGGEEARALFRDVLIASASVPGVFPPKMLPVESGGQTFQEMHVDGGATTPFFVVPQLLTLRRDPDQSLRGGHIYVILNGQIESRPMATQLNTVPIVARSFDTMMMYQSRQALALTSAFAERNGLTFEVAYIGVDYDFAGSMEFDTDALRGLFDYARTQAARDEPWTTPEQFRTHLTRRTEEALQNAPQSGQTEPPAPNPTP